jgi:hypothetical protein
LTIAAHAASNKLTFLEVAIMDRRYFLKTSGIGLASFGLMAAAPEFLHQFASAQTSKSVYGKRKSS